VRASPLGPLEHAVSAREPTQTSGWLHIAIFALGAGCTFENRGCTVGVTGCTPTGRGCLGAIGRCCSVRGKSAAPPAAAVFLLKSEAFPLVLPRLAGRQVQGRGYAQPPLVRDWSQRTASGCQGRFH
jgi:hypothetical protein